MDEVRKPVGIVMFSEQSYNGEVGRLLFFFFASSLADNKHARRSNAINGTSPTSILTGCSGCSQTSASRSARRLFSFFTS
jgi:hypothetical protein